MKGNDYVSPENESFSPPDDSFKGFKPYSYHVSVSEFYDFDYTFLIDWALSEYIALDITDKGPFPKMLPIKDFPEFSKWLKSAFDHILKLYSSLIEIQRMNQLEK